MDAVLHPNQHPHPSKEEVRAWLVRRCRTQVPPPAPDEIRRELGWVLPPGASANATGPFPAANCATIFPANFSPYFPPIIPFALPLMLAELATLTAIAWYCLACQPSRQNFLPNT